MEITVWVIRNSSVWWTIEHCEVWRWVHLVTFFYIYKLQIHLHKCPSSLFCTRQSCLIDLLELSNWIAQWTLSCAITTVSPSGAQSGRLLWLLEVCEARDPEGSAGGTERHQFPLVNHCDDTGRVWLSMSHMTASVSYNQISAVSWITEETTGK